MIFYLGTHMPSWLEDPRFAEVPLFVSRRTLAGRKKLPRAVGPWALDSGGFTELQLHGRWTFSAAEYVADVRRFRDEIGGLMFAAPMDWMCEDAILHGDKGVVHDRKVVMKTIPGWGTGYVEVMGPVVVRPKFHGTGLTIQEHQRRTVDNFLELKSLAPDLPFMPVLQGWNEGDYFHCLDLYDRAGVNLRKEPRVGVGTVCRRQGTHAATRILSRLAAEGLRLHGFGFKTQGLQESHDDLASADSLAWSFAARRKPPLPGHDKPGDGRRTGHINCANCATFALEWRADLIASLPPPGDGGPGGGRGRKQLGLWAAEVSP